MTDESSALAIAHPETGESLLSSNGDGVLETPFGEFPGPVSLRRYLRERRVIRHDEDTLEAGLTKLFDRVFGARRRKQAEEQAKKRRRHFPGIEKLVMKACDPRYELMVYENPALAAQRFGIRLSRRERDILQTRGRALVIPVSDLAWDFGPGSRERLSGLERLLLKAADQKHRELVNKDPLGAARHFKIELADVERLLLSNIRRKDLNLAITTVERHLLKDGKVVPNRRVRLQQGMRNRIFPVPAELTNGRRPKNPRKRLRQLVSETFDPDKPMPRIPTWRTMREELMRVSGIRPWDDGGGSVYGNDDDDSRRKRRRGRRRSRFRGPGAGMGRGSFGGGGPRGGGRPGPRGARPFGGRPRSGPSRGGPRSGGGGGFRRSGPDSRDDSRGRPPRFSRSSRDNGGGNGRYPGGGGPGGNGRRPSSSGGSSNRGYRSGPRTGGGDYRQRRESSQGSRSGGGGYDSRGQRGYSSNSSGGRPPRSGGGGYSRGQGAPSRSPRNDRPPRSGGSSGYSSSQRSGGGSRNHTGGGPPRGGSSHSGPRRPGPSTGGGGGPRRPRRP